MNPRRIYGAFFCEREEERLEDLSLGELASKLDSIKSNKEHIRKCGLSTEVTSLAIKELDEQDKKVRHAMHKVIDLL